MSIDNEASRHDAAVEAAKAASVALGTIAGVVGTAGAGRAAIQLFDSSDDVTANPSTVPFSLSPGSGTWDIDQDGTPEAQLSNSTTYVATGTKNSPSGSTVTAVSFSSLASGFGVAATKGSNVQAFGSAATIGSSLSFASSARIEPFFAPPVLNEDPGQFIGFAFDSSGTQLFGWAEVTYSSGTDTLTIDRWAFDDTGAPIQTGQTQEVPFGTEGAGAAAAMAAGAGIAASHLAKHRRRVKSLENSLSGGEEMALLVRGAAGVRAWRDRKSEN